MFAEVVVDTHQDPTKRFFTYAVPEELAKKVKEGAKVLVPFGKRSVEGYVFELTRARPSFPTKEIKEIRGTAFSPSQVELARWMAAYYFAPPLDCLKCQLQGKGERATAGNPKNITTLLLVPYANQVKSALLNLSGLQDSQKEGILAGSRSAVFAPLPNLKKIIIEEPENWNYKDERSPYHHANDVAQKRAELEELKLELRYLVPRVEDLSTGRQDPLPSNLPGLQFSTRKVKIVDLQKERAAGNFSRLSAPVTEVFKRPSPRGLGNLAYTNSKEAKEEIRQAIKEQNLDINRIETAGAEVFGQIGKWYAAVVMIDADTLFNLPDFRAHEKLITTVARLAKLTKGRLYIQTSNANHPLFRELKTGNLKSFYQRELKSRKPFLYPPFGILAKLELSAKATAKVESGAESLYRKLLAVSRKPLAVEISLPYSPYSKTRGKAQLNIAVKAKSRRQLEKILTAIPPTWRVIVDPESLL